MSFPNDQSNPAGAIPVWSAPAPAGSASGITFAETASTLSNGAVAIAANLNRRGLILANPSDTVMTLRIGGSVASATVGIPIPAGTALVLSGSTVTGQAASLFCAGTSKAYTIYEW